MFGLMIHQRRFSSFLFSCLIGLSLNPLLLVSLARSQTLAYCKLSSQAITQKEGLRQTALTGDAQAIQNYNTILTQHAQQINQCRQRINPKNQAIWLRLYPCDARPGEIDRILDNIINRGYNKVYLEVFYDGQVLLPSSRNSTAWPSAMRSPGSENQDLLAETIQKGRQRGLKVYAWMFMLNYGYTYTLKPDRNSVLARNGKGETTTTAVIDQTKIDEYGESFVNQGFVDPYHPTAQQDYLTLLNSILQRRPDGVLFDYVRYPKGLGGESVATKVKDLWIYGEASQQAFLNRASSQKGRDLMQRFIQQGFITENDVKAVNEKHPDEKDKPYWPDEKQWKTLASIPKMGETLQLQLWRLSVAHARQGVLDFLAIATQPVQSQGIPAGAVFFPEANRKIGGMGFDSRMQPWDQFSSSIEWHPMSYAVCGETNCITAQVQQVIQQALPGTQVIPALAGDWGKSIKNRPSLEQQMVNISATIPQINAFSHYGYDWQDLEETRQRKFCKR
jgi:Glycosyl hydrolase-like 10